MHVDWPRLAADGKAFKWKRPSCPKHCPVKLWGHGRVVRYFAHLAAGVFVQRFRCRSCGAVVTMRPSGYWPRYQTNASTIFTVLRTRLADRGWGAGVARQRAGHWLRRLIAHVAFEYPGADAAATLARLFAAGVHFLV